MESQHEEREDEYSDDFTFQNSAEVMIVVNEWNLQCVWTPEYYLQCKSDGGCLSDNILLDLRRIRAEMVTFKDQKIKYVDTVTRVENDLMMPNYSCVNNQSGCLDSDTIKCPLPNENTDKVLISPIYVYNQKKTSALIMLTKDTHVLLNKNKEIRTYGQGSDNSFRICDETSPNNVNISPNWNYQYVSRCLSSRNVFNHSEKN